MGALSVGDVRTGTIPSLLPSQKHYLKVYKNGRAKSMQFEITDSELSFVLDGDLESPAGELCRKMQGILSETEGYKRVVVNVSGVSGADCQGLHLLAGLQQECRKRQLKFRITGATPDNERLLNLLRISDCGLRIGKEGRGDRVAR
ncbi:MAG: STAS domain-containing protein [Pseudomonadota bacterium]